MENKTKRIPIPYKTKSLLQKEISSTCPFCSNEDVDHFQFHHIDENPKNNNVSNILMLCPICHSKITKGDIAREEVEQKKQDISTNRKDIVLFVQEISPLIFDLIIFGEQEKDRSINPWASELNSLYEKIANELRRMSIQDVAIQKGWKENMNGLAGLVDRFLNSKKHKCIGVSLSEEIKAVVENATFFKRKKIDPFFATQRIQLTLKEDYIQNIRLLSNLNDRAEMMLNGDRFEELQREVSKIGHKLLILSMYNTDHFSNPVKSKLHDIAQEIHIMEMKISKHSFNRKESFKNQLNELCGQLNALAVEMPEQDNYCL